MGTPIGICVPDTLKLRTNLRLRDPIRDDASADAPRPCPARALPSSIVRLQRRRAACRRIFLQLGLGAQQSAGNPVPAGSNPSAYPSAPCATTPLHESLNRVAVSDSQRAPYRVCRETQIRRRCSQRLRHRRPFQS